MMQHGLDRSGGIIKVHLDRTKIQGDFIKCDTGGGDTSRDGPAVACRVWVEMERHARMMRVVIVVWYDTVVPFGVWS